MKPIVILYHASCPDGFGAAWAARKKFGGRATYIPAEYDNTFVSGLEDKKLYLLDFSYSAEKIKQLVKANKKVVILDHHISQKEEIKNASDYVFDNNRSGAVITWRYFHPKKKVPVFLRYIEDGDLWRFKLPASQMITTYIYSHPFEFKIFDQLEKELATSQGRKAAEAKGKIIADYEHLLVEEVVNKADIVEFQGMKILAANCPIKKINSEIGHRLYEKMPPMSIIWYESKNLIRVSLRSNGEIDVSEIAKSFGGGGHKAAAGFEFPADRPFPWKRIHPVRNGPE